MRSGSLRSISIGVAWGQVRLQRINNHRNELKRLGGYWRFVIISAVLIIFLNIVCTIKAVADFYRRHIFWLWSETYGRVTGWFPFSVSWVMLGLAAIFLTVFVIALVLLIFLHRREKYKAFVRGYAKCLLTLVLCVLMLYTLNCTALYHCSTMAKNEKTYTLEELELLRNYLAAEAKACGSFERDDTGISVYPGEDMLAGVKQAMQRLSDTIPELSGYYPDVKHFLSSDVMYYADYIGMFYPYAMEVNVSKYLSDVWYPSTAAHELAHLKGFIYEDEAEFISYLACTGSEDAFFRYSGYMLALSYVEDAYINALIDAYGTDAGLDYYYRLDVDIECLLDNYFNDMCCYKDTEEFDELTRQEESPIIQSFHETEDALIESAHEFVGYEPNYDEVTKLLLEYYDGVLY